MLFRGRAVLMLMVIMTVILLIRQQPGGKNPWV